ncbi:HTH domain-containing protein [Otoolea muris]|uniref:HTH domain-containing protein n=1 Tax=Otoolea muris TaxID=2941515 RepID=UPI0020408163|nr:HTH domain-containing protein [Otoolea muris]
MSYAERREAILEVLCIRRHETYRNLAFEFHVSRETIRHDIAALMCLYPIETVRGRYGGGVKLAEGFDPYRRKLTARQAALLIKLSAQLTGDELSILDSILRQFAP